MWGQEGEKKTKGYGLAKIAKWHPEVLNDLQGILNRMQKISETPNTVQLDSPDHHAAIRLNWFGKEKKWLLTQYEKPLHAGKTIDASDKPVSGPGGTTLPPENGSIDIIGAPEPEVKGKCP